MQHAPNHTLVGAGPASRTAGVDWARDDHVVTVVGPGGEVVHRFTVEHTAAGLHDLISLLGRLGVPEVAIERPDAPWWRPCWRLI